MTQSQTKPLLAAASGQQPKRTPVWFLRQAGRYLPEYREVRKNFDFVGLCSNPEKAAEVTLQPLKRFDLDAAIIFADILLPCIALGQSLRFDKGHGPVLSEAVRGPETLAKLSIPNDISKELGYVGEAIERTKQGLADHQTMIGFAGAPFTVASYMIEGSGSKNYSELKKLLFSETAIFTELLTMVTETTKSYLRMQIKAGAEYLMLFDTWANQIPAHFYREFVFNHVQEIVSDIQTTGVPIAYFPGQGLNMLGELSGINANVIHVDWRPRLEKAIDVLNASGLAVPVQGNLDPQIFMAQDETIEREVHRILKEGLKAKSHIFNVGHGLLPSTPTAGIEKAVSVVREYDRNRV